MVSSLGSSGLELVSRFSSFPFEVEKEIKAKPPDSCGSSLLSNKPTNNAECPKT